MSVLVYKLNACKVDSEELIPYSTWDGHYNHMPTPFVEITENEYVHRTSDSLPECQWHQQVTNLPGESQMVSLTFIKFKENVYAKSSPSGWRCATAQEKEAGEYSIIYTKPARYFRIGCNHEYTDKMIGICLHELTCSKCGYSRMVDSSG